jgi:GGDEF domain-containing protein
VVCKVGISIGIALFPLDGLDADPLLSTAETALYHVKKGGRNNYHIPARFLMEPPRP